jgi:hypothetical protein
MDNGDLIAAYDTEWQTLGVLRDVQMETDLAYDATRERDWKSHFR